MREPAFRSQRLTTKYEFFVLRKWAAAFCAQIAPHLYNGPIGAATSIQLATATPTFLIQESTMTWGSVHAEVWQEKIEWRVGYIILSGKPGLGVELNMDVVKAHSPDSGKKLHLSMAQVPTISSSNPIKLGSGGPNIAIVGSGSTTWGDEL